VGENQSTRNENALTNTPPKALKSGNREPNIGETEFLKERRMKEELKRKQYGKEGKNKTIKEMMKKEGRNANGKRGRNE
jgi:hypothetical protein